MMQQDIQLMLSAAIDQLEDRPELVHKMFKVVGHTQDLALSEGFEEVERDMVLSAAILHNIGQAETERRLDRGEEAEEADIAEEMIRELLEPSDLNTFEIEGILILVRTHKQVGFLENPMHQLLSEALLLAEIAEAEDPNARAIEVSKIFKSDSAIKRLKAAYPLAFAEEN